ncbi:GEVED domain-containing protein [Flavobacterium sp. UBA4197]|uniref:GEVED domain-containing protein n=1 Tax=Flavobacterium sp. UBA4197 TaxID=1946546 RepID=UPI00257F5DF4|nr:GEVED domain-containing protein [Flavobacterium sp. UBA4197]
MYSNDKKQSNLRLYQWKMKCFLLGLFLLPIATFAQVSNYIFSQNPGTYTELANPVVLATATALSGSASLDDVIYTIPNNSIPFAFTLNNIAYSGAKVSTNGFVTLGATAPSSSLTSPISNSTGYTAAISAVGSDLNALFNIEGKTGSIGYEVVGTAPNREFVIEWKHFRPYSSSATVSSYFDWNFQIRLRENNTVAIVYDLKITGVPTSALVQVGLRGASDADYTNRSAGGTANSHWMATAAGTSSSSSVTCNSTSLPTSGYTFIWTPPSPCVAPVAQPSNLVLTVAGTTVNGVFEAASPAVDKYLVVRTPLGTAPTPPVNGTTYATGTGLGGYIVSNTASLTFVSSALTGNTAYTFTVFAYNSACSGGPLYNAANPVSQNITTCPAAPGTVTNANITATSFDLNWVASAGGSAAAVAYFVEVATDANFTSQIAGSPFSAQAALTYAVQNISNSTKYYYRVRANNGCNSAYSSVGNLTTLCLPVAAFNENFDNAVTPDLAGCWSKIIRGTGTGSSSVATSSTSGSSTPNAVNLYNSGANTDNAGVDVILVSPQLTNLNAGNYRLRFKARRSSTTAGNNIQIGTLDNNSATAVFTPFGSVTELTTEYKEFTVYFTSYTGTDSFIGLKRKGSTTYSNVFVDDVVWEAIPSCLSPVTLTVSGITPNQAAISWNFDSNAGAPNGGYEYFISDTNTAPGLTDLLLQTTQTTATIGQLQSGTTYYVFVRSVCGANDKSNWTKTSFTTILTTPAPWLEPFTGTTTPNGWTTTGWTIGTERGATGNTGNNIYKNLYNTAPTGTFKTINVGPLPANYQLSFDYKQSAFSTPYSPLATWGNYTVEVSTDFGTTWTNITNIENEQGTGNYISKVYSLAAYATQYVSIRVTANRTAGDYDLSFDNFKIDAAPDNTVPVTSVVVTTENNVPAAITTNHGTLQLVAAALPANANQQVSWSVSNNMGMATVSATGLVTAVTNGVVTVRATATADTAIFGEIQITITNQLPVYCTPAFPQGVEPITLVNFAGINNVTSNALTSPAYEDFTAITGTVVKGQNYPIKLKGNTDGSLSSYFKVYIDWNQNGTFETEEGYELGYISNSTGIDVKELTGTIPVPQTAFLGTTRMRVLKKFASQSIAPCNTESYGQAEDYTLLVEETMGSGDFDKTNYVVYPNPTTSVVNIQSDAAVKSVKVYNHSGQLVKEDKNNTLDLSAVSEGMYILQITFENGKSATRKIIKK